MSTSQQFSPIYDDGGEISNYLEELKNKLQKNLILKLSQFQHK